MPRDVPPAPRDGPRSAVAFATLLATAALWGSTFVVIKDAIREVDPVTLVAWRFLTAFVLLAAVARTRGHSLRPSRSGVWLGLALGGAFLSQTVGLTVTSAANSAFLTGLFAALVPIVLWVARLEPIGATRATGIALASAGLWLVTGGVSGVNAGDLATLLGAFFFAVHIVIADRLLGGGADFEALNVQQMGVVALAAFAVALALGRDLSLDRSVLAAIAYLAVFATALAYLAQLFAQTRLAPVIVAFVLALEPLFGAAFAWTLGGETFRPAALVGGLLVASAIALEGWASAGGGRARATPEPPA